MKDLLNYDQLQKHYWSDGNCFNYRDSKMILHGEAKYMYESCFYIKNLLEGEEILYKKSELKLKI